MLSDDKYDAKQNETTETGLKILTPKHLKFCRWKTTDNNDINIFMSLERKALKIHFLILIVSYHKIVQKSKLRHYIIFCFDWKIVVFQQTVVRVYYTLKQKTDEVPENLCSTYD